MMAGKRVLNIDESSVGQSVFDRKSWGLQGGRNAGAVFGARFYKNLTKMA